MPAARKKFFKRLGKIKFPETYFQTRRRWFKPEFLAKSNAERSRILAKFYRQLDQSYSGVANIKRGLLSALKAIQEQTSPERQKQIALRYREDFFRAKEVGKLLNQSARIFAEDYLEVYTKGGKIERPN